MMSVVAIAGGLGDMGRLITASIYETGKYEVYIMSRRVSTTKLASLSLIILIDADSLQAPKDVPTYTSPLTGKTYNPIIETDYASVGNVARLLTEHNVHTVICTFALDFEAASNSQLNLIRAAEQSPCVKRFLPSEFNIDYDLDDSLLPYPDKRYHTVARRLLETTSSLEYSYIYPGMFSDYWAMPHIKTHLRPLCIVMDPESGVAAIPGDGEARVSMSYTGDVARYTALALDLPKWPRAMTTATDAITLNELVHLAEVNLGRKLNITYQPIEALKRHETTVLPRNLPLASHFPEGLDQLKALTSDLEASMALGAYDFETLEGHLDLVKQFESRTASPLRIEKLLELAWKGR